MVQHLHHLHYPETLNTDNKRFPCYDYPIGWSNPVVSGEHKINISLLKTHRTELSPVFTTGRILVSLKMWCAVLPPNGIFEKHFW